VNGKKVKFLPECNDPSKEWKFPKDLGIGKCDNMDTLPPFCGSGTQTSPKRWTSDWMCQAKFCHVDPDNCPDDWVISGNLFPGLAFSYRTCLPDDASDAQKSRAMHETGILRKYHRAYHCAADETDPNLQKAADKDSAIQAGNTMCPCLTAEQLDSSKGGYFPEKIYEEKVNGKKVKFLPECNDPSKEWKFPKDLGIGKCDNMDTLPPFCGSGTQTSPKRWTSDWMCQAKFCHVDPDNCPDDWVISGNLFPGLAFSYRTCLPDDASDAQKSRAMHETGILRKYHRAYHCAADETDPNLQKAADKDD